MQLVSWYLSLLGAVLKGGPDLLLRGVGPEYPGGRVVKVHRHDARATRHGRHQRGLGVDVVGDDLAALGHQEHGRYGICQARGLWPKAVSLLLVTREIDA